MTERVTRRDVEVAEDAARAHLMEVRDPEREGWACVDCVNAEDAAFPYGLEPDPVRWVWRDDDEGRGDPVCEWHASERVHEAIPYGANCSQCGRRHSALWPTGEPLFDREDMTDV